MVPSPKSVKVLKSRHITTEAVSSSIFLEVSSPVGDTHDITITETTNRGSSRSQDVLFMYVRPTSIEA